VLQHEQTENHGEGGIAEGQVPCVADDWVEDSRTASSAAAGREVLEIERGDTTLESGGIATVSRSQVQDPLAARRLPDRTPEVITERLVAVDHGTAGAEDPGKVATEVIDGPGFPGLVEGLLGLWVEETVT